MCYGTGQVAGHGSAHKWAERLAVDQWSDVPRILRTAVLAAGVIFGITAWGCPVARADWDIEAYDNCMADSAEHGEPDFQGCCLSSGGVWKLDEQKCVAPPANSGNAQGSSTQQPVAPSRAPGIGPKPLPVVSAP